MSRPLCPRCRVPLHDDGRCRSCYEVETGLCASHGHPRKSCPPCLATRYDVEGPRQRRLRALTDFARGERREATAEGDGR